MSYRLGAYVKMPDKERYRHHIPRIVRYLELNKDQDPLDLAGIISVFTDCPIIVVYQYLGELHGETSMLLTKINNVRIFYNYG